MPAHIEIKLFATLKGFMPDSAENYAIKPGTTIHTLIQQLDLPENQVKLIFINGVKADRTTVLKGGERIGIFPPVGGG